MNLKYFFAFKEACAHIQSYSYTDYIELCVLVNEMCTLELPSTNQWKIVEKFRRTKYMLHTRRHEDLNAEWYLLGIASLFSRSC